MNKTINAILDSYIEKHLEDEEKLGELTSFINDFFANMEDDYSEVRDAFYAEVEDFTDEITMEMLRETIEHLKHKDGEVSGIKWNYEEVQNVAKQYDVKSKVEACGKKFCCEKFWFAMNYVYATHFSVNRTVNGYVDLAIDEICNKNVCFDRLIKKIFEKI